MKFGYPGGDAEKYLAIERKNEVKPEFWAVGLDVTQHCNIADDDKKYIKRIIDVFMYDKNTVTHLCEAAPSYFLEYLYTFVEFTDYMNTIDGDVTDHIDQAYCYSPTDDSYSHCGDIDKLTDFHQKVTGVRASVDDDVEDVREFLFGNRPF